MRYVAKPALAAAAAVVFGATSARAQIDYRNLDDGRPVHTEDAYPVERYAFELLLPARLQNFPGGLRTATITPELEYGLMPNGQVGLALPVAVVRSPGASGLGELGLGGLRLHGFYNFNTESRSFPALALRADLALPVGALAGDVTRLTVKAIATRSWGLTRAHLNAAWSLGSDDGLAEAGAAARWSGSLAVDRTLFRSSLLMVLEGLAEQEIRGAPTSVIMAGGVRWQRSPTTVVDVGVSRRLTSSGPSFGATVGVSHAFAVPGLMPAGGR
jgi:hypothetical protein